MDEEPDEAIIRFNNQAVELFAQGQYTQARAAALLSRELALQRYGPNDLRFARSVSNLATIQRALGQYTEAETFYRQVLEIQQAADAQPADRAMTLNNLAALLRTKGAYEASRLALQEAIKIQREVFPQPHLDLAISLNNLALVYEITGDYAQARSLYVESLYIRRKILPTNDPSIAAVLVNLAGLSSSIGQFSEAEHLYREARDILHLHSGDESIEMATLLNNLALLYDQMRDYEQAIELHARALALRTRLLGEHHPDTATSKNNLALLFEKLGRYEQSDPLQQEALASRLRCFGLEHADVAQSLNNLAGRYWLAGASQEAEQLHQQALTIRRKLFGDVHPDVAQSLHNLGSLYHGCSRYEEAEHCYQEALLIRRQIYGDIHPEVAQTLYHLAYLSAGTNRVWEALKMMEQVAAVDSHVMSQVFAIGSEAQRMAYLVTLQDRFEALVSLVLFQLPDSPTALATAMNLILRRKAIGAEAFAVQREAVLGGKYPALATELEQLTQLRTQIARKALAGPGLEEYATYQRTLADWKAQKSALEAALAQQIPEMSLQQTLQSVGCQAITRQLPEQAALVEIVRVTPYDFSAAPVQGIAVCNAPHYAAFLLHPRYPDKVFLHDLGETQVIDELLTALLPREGAYLRAASGRRATRHIKVGGYPQREKASHAGQQLRTLLIDPLLPDLAGATHLLISPDGELSLLPFGILPTEDSRYLIDLYQISYLSAGRDVLRFCTAPSSLATPPLVIANPNYDLKQGEAHADPTENQRQRGSKGSKSREIDHSLRLFEPLEGAAQEGQMVAQILSAQLLMGDTALESLLKSCHAPRILHIATHGFFLPDQPGAPVAAPDQEGKSVPAQRLEWMAHLENPLLRSGLALAGANTWLRGEEPPPEAEDGLLTAEDVSGLDLFDTDLVVLSACETGLGSIALGEGVFGLRRAVVLAGAKTLVMSLWKINDRRTQSLMRQLYRGVKMGRSYADALREAQLVLKEKHPHPYYWGAFICQGDPLLRHQ